MHAHTLFFPIIPNQVDECPLLSLKELLLVFSESTDLRVNCYKSPMAPIDVEDQEASRLDIIFGRQLGTLLVTHPHANEYHKTKPGRFHACS